MYVPGKMKDGDKVLVDIGTGYYVEKVTQRVEYMYDLFTSRGPKITLPFPRLYICISVYLCVRTYYVRDNYVMYIVAMRPYFS